MIFDQSTSSSSKSQGAAARGFPIISDCDSQPRPAAAAQALAVPPFARTHYWPPALDEVPSWAVGPRPERHSLDAQMRHRAAHPAHHPVLRASAECRYSSNGREDAWPPVPPLVGRAAQRSGDAHELMPWPHARGPYGGYPAAPAAAWLPGRRAGTPVEGRHAQDVTLAARERTPVDTCPAVQWPVTAPDVHPTASAPVATHLRDDDPLSLDWMDAALDASLPPHAF